MYLGSILIPLALLSPASANERRFTHVYETETLPRNAVEIEPWTTISPGTYGFEFAHRLAFEVGVSDRLQSAFYLNFGSTEADGFAYDGVSSEWTYRILSRHVKPVGLALYAEASLKPMGSEFEAKILVDKEIGPVLVAYNLVGELEFERVVVAPERDTADQNNLAAFEIEIERETVVENNLAIAVRPGNDRFGVGAELIHELALGDEVEGYLSLGPVLSYARQRWWAAASVVAEVVGAPEGELPWKARVLLGFPL